MGTMLRVRTTLSYGAGGPGLCTHYWACASATPTTAEALDAGARVRAFWAALAGLLPTTASASVQGQMDGIDWTTGALVPGASIAPPAIVPGTAATPQLPPQVAVVVRYNTNTIVAGRKLEGRSYVSPLSTVIQTSAGAPGTGVGTAVGNALTALLAVTSTASPVVWHRPKAAGSGQVGIIVGGSAWSLFGSLRSRRD